MNNLKQHLKILSAFGLTMITFFIFSCGSGENKSEDTTTEMPFGNTSSKVSTTYNPFDIDKTAPVVEITIKATGNNMQEMKYDKTELRIKSRNNREDNFY